MNVFFTALTCLLALLCNQSIAAAIPDNTRQLIVVVTDNWSTPIGRLHLLSRADVNDAWREIGTKKPVVVGKNGMGWGLGLHGDISSFGEPVKKEGDLKAPAGIFSLGVAFGRQDDMFIKMPYLKLTPTTEAVDDPKSRYYNQIVDAQFIAERDWTSTEKMFIIAQYELGVVVNHNTADIIPGAGSQIFLHVWVRPDLGTAGCTAMTLEDMTEVAQWLDPRANPVLVQLPQANYAALTSSWHLPTLSDVAEYEM